MAKNQSTDFTTSRELGDRVRKSGQVNKHISEPPASHVTPPLTCFCTHVEHAWSLPNGLVISDTCISGYPRS